MNSFESAVPFYCSVCSKEIGFRRLNGFNRVKIPQEFCLDCGDRESKSAFQFSDETAICHMRFTKYEGVREKDQSVYRGFFSDVYGPENLVMQMLRETNLIGRACCWLTEPTVKAGIIKGTLDWEWDRKFLKC